LFTKSLNCFSATLSGKTTVRAAGTKSHLFVPIDQETVHLQCPGKPLSPAGSFIIGEDFQAGWILPLHTCTISIKQ
jgi:hypothetical protein